MAAIPATTGLDLTEDKLRLKPGTLQECQNYEIAYRAGYSRMEGMRRYDGRPETADLSVYRGLVETAPGGPVYGMHHFTDRSSDQSWLYAVVESTRIALGSRPMAAENIAVPGQRVEVYVTTPTGSPNAWVLEANASFAGETRDLIEVLIDSDAEVFSGSIVAYTRVEFKDGSNMPAAGAQITDAVSGWIGTVRSVDIASGTAATNDIAGSLWVEIDTAGNLAPGAALTMVVGGAVVAQVVTVEGYSDNGVLVGDAISVITDISETVNRGTLIRSTGQGWDTVQQAYEVNFTGGQNKPADVFSSGGAIDESETPTALPAEPGQTAYWDDTGAAIDWDKDDSTLRDAIQSDDASYTDAAMTAAGQVTEFIRVRDFDDAIDALDEPTGVEIQVICERAAGTMDLTIDRVQSSSNAVRGVGTVVDTKATLTFGGPNDMWGASSSEELRNNLNDAAYQWLVRFKAAGTDAATTARVYMIRRVVHLRSGSLESVVYLRAGGTDYKARAIQTHVASGRWDTNNAAGVITLARVDNPAVIPANAVVRTAPDGGGDVVATLDGSLTPLRLPSRARMKLKKSQFQFIDSNFFAAGRLAAVYGVSGAGFAFTFNNNYLFHIRTGRTVDEPRHVARHKERLVLGYENGDADFSVGTEPALFDGVLGAYSLGFGRRITGMLPLSGETLGVWTETSIHGVQGSTTADVIQQVLEAETGALEYTVVDMGIPVFCDFRGISTLQGSAAYGDFDGGRLSRAVRSWLLERIQEDGASGIRPILAEAVPKKSQYKLWFEDGYVLTLTWWEDRVPRWTIQKPYLDAEETPLTIICTASGVDEFNEPLTFASFEESNRAFRTNHGDDFDGTLIRAFHTYNPIHGNGPAMNLRVNVIHIHGVASGLVELKTQIGVDYALPAGHTAVAQLGSVALTEQRPVFTKTRHKARGRDFALRIETTTNTPHTIQVIDFPDLSHRKLER